MKFSTPSRLGMNYSSMSYLYIKAKLDLIVKINVYIINKNDSLK